LRRRRFLPGIAAGGNALPRGEDGDTGEQGEQA
jgi:hypothetical protein